jgi:type II secretory pathway pseudopilin PulG
MRLRTHRDAPRQGFTLVELLATTATLSALIALLLPAVQSSREASRRSQCVSHLRQVALALVSFEATHGAFPQGGWGSDWMPVPGSGFGPSQPGSWCYRVLGELGEVDPFTLTETSDDPELPLALPPVAVLNCPSRRPLELWPIGVRFPRQRRPLPGGVIDYGPKSDYAINAGASHFFLMPGPADVSIGIDPRYWGSVTSNKGFTGVSHLRRSVGSEQVVDGLSHTYLVAEKWVESQLVVSGDSIGDDHTMYTGYDVDNHRWVASVKMVNLQKDVDPDVIYPPMRDLDAIQPAVIGGPAPTWRPAFGSAHAEVWNAARCDGSVRPQVFDIEPLVHYQLGRRDDHRPFSE